MNRKYNFSAGPATLPLPVLEEAKQQLLNYKNAGMSVLEMSHRSKDFITILEETKTALTKVLSIPDNYDVMFLTGGASTQFATLPMNFLKNSAGYINTGSWSKKAIKEAKLFGNVNVVASSEEQNFNYIPQDISLPGDVDYNHITSNNTIFGTQWLQFPQRGESPLFVDMSSDILSRKFDIQNFDVVYAGAQKNAGPAGVTIVIMRKDLTEKSNTSLPSMFQYKIHADKDSCYNTPPVFQIYLVGLIAKWIESEGGLETIEKRNRQKGELLYQTMDERSSFYTGTAKKDSRSFMNVTFRLPSEELEKKFLQETETKSFSGLKGHRSVGGIRVSMYNAMSLEGIEKLTEFMKDFAQQNS
ncbi:3-phosphoserine/phosphohydroxythreonine transaminase [Candidatus Uabimicrobium sp. HlEnr_7]|uniref:3-phosphoserine/phosphohydroxythreonine transaminase n=1 Tax=Candidatus Uabimicrobium helgolandensis TaxID=3095367 RepID=UPI00355932AB